LRVVQNVIPGVGARRDYQAYSTVAALAVRPAFVCNEAMTNPKHRVDVQAQVAYIAEQSDVDAKRFVFAYTMTITNSGSVAARLITRHWIITDANGEVQEVKGDGVIGEQPLLRPQQSFQYTSGTYISTPVGTMRGSYQMLGEDGEEFDADIPEFTLAMPGMLH
jgi:ApaG protein